MDEARIVDAFAQGSIAYRFEGPRDSFKGTLEIKESQPTLDPFGRERPLLHLEDRIAGYGTNEVFIDTNNRTAAKSVSEKPFFQVDFDSFSPSFDHHDLPHLLLMIDSRDWGERSYTQRFSGEEFTLAGQWSDNTLDIHAQNERRAFNVTFTFEGPPAIETLQEVRANSTHDYIFDIQQVSIKEDAQTQMPEDSQERVSPLTPHPMATFLEMDQTPMAFPLKDAWEALKTDPRTAVEMTKDPRLLIAYHDRGGSAFHRTDEWRLALTTNDGGSFYANVERPYLEELVVPARVTATGPQSFEPAEETLPGWFSWNEVLDLCASHTGTQVQEVTEVWFGPPSIALIADGPLLMFAYTPTDDTFAEVVCAFDIIDGWPLWFYGLDNAYGVPH